MCEVRFGGNAPSLLIMTNENQNNFNLKPQIIRLIKIKTDKLCTI